MRLIQVVEERNELCSIASKVVSLKLIRQKRQDCYSSDGEIIGFECSSSSPTCESKCTYKMLVEDY